MGNDIFWRGNETSRKLQDSCTEFLKQVALQAEWEFERFSGKIKGNIIDRHTRYSLEIEKKGGIEAFFPYLAESTDNVDQSNMSEKLGPLFQNEIDLNGIRIFPTGKETAIDNDISGHLSFVFINSFSGHIFTIYDETLVTDRRTPHEYYKRQYGDSYNPSLPIYTITPGGNTRSLGEPLRLLLILGLIRLRYVKNLVLSCDYRISEETNLWIQKKIRDEIKNFDDEEAFVSDAVSSIFSD